MKWHYTTQAHLEMIVRSGAILPATAGVPVDEKPIVWFSANPWWEETANKLLADPDGSIRHLDMMETHCFCGGLVRIGVAAMTAPLDWEALKRKSCMSYRMAAGLYRIAIDAGARPGQWWGTFDPVPASQWVALDLFDGSRWVPAAERMGGTEHLPSTDGKPAPQVVDPSTEAEPATADRVSCDHLELRGGEVSA